MTPNNFNDIHDKYLKLEKEMDAAQSVVFRKEKQLEDARKELARVSKEYEQYKDVVLAFIRIRDK